MGKNIFNIKLSYRCFVCVYWWKVIYNQIMYNMGYIIKSNLSAPSSLHCKCSSESFYSVDSVCSERFVQKIRLTKAINSRIGRRQFTLHYDYDAVRGETERAENTNSLNTDLRGYAL